jgi:hypothetical protein
MNPPKKVFQVPRNLDVLASRKIYEKMPAAGSEHETQIHSRGKQLDDTLHTLHSEAY